MTDKELFYQVLRREIDNFLGRFGPTFRMFSNSVSNYVIKYIDPYIDAFMFDGKEINTEAAEGFVKEEVNERLEKFIKKFKENKSGNDL